MIVLFGLIKFMNVVFIFVEFGVEIGIVSVLFVLNVYWSNFFVLFIRLMKLGFRCFIVLCVMVFSICGLMFDGLGFIKVCWGGIWFV